jgi:phosphatidylinositol alpha 1,6-mannosyltransferase
VRIAHVSDCFAPRTGGIETQVGALALRQIDAGDDVRVITATPGHGAVFAGDEFVDGLMVHRVAAHMPFELPVHPRTGREVSRLLARDPVDVVHVHAGVVSPFAWGAIRAATRAGVPTLVTVHSIWGPIARPGFGVSDALLRWSRWGVTLSAVSDVAASRISAAIPRAGQVLVTPNGIDPAEWVVQHVDAGPAVLRLASVLRMAPRKRTLPLVKIIEGVVRRLDGVDVTASLVGDGPERARAEKYVMEQGLADAIRFTGRLDGRGILEVFSHTDAYVQPSVKESFGLAALEARTAGLPIVARSQTGTTQFVHDHVEGLLADDDAGMVAAVVRLGRDRDLLSRIAAHNTGVGPREAWPSVLQTVKRAYRVAGANGP